MEQEQQKVRQNRRQGDGVHGYAAFRFRRIKKKKPDAGEDSQCSEKGVQVKTVVAENDKKGQKSTDCDGEDIGRRIVYGGIHLFLY